MSKKINKKKRKVARSQKATNQPSALAVIPYEQIAQPEIYRGRYSLTPTRLNEIQIKAIISPTPENVIKKRPGKGGGEWDFIPGWWFKKRLNFVFGFDGWDTAIDGERIDGNYITVKGRLIIHDAKTGKDIVSKADYGGAEIKFKKGMKEYLDISNDFKAAQTDLIKRCCVQLGFAMDVYGKAESREVGQNIVYKPDQPTAGQKPSQGASITLKKGQVAGPDGNPVYLCIVGQEIISEAEYNYSMKMFKKPLCREHQKSHGK